MSFSPCEKRKPQQIDVFAPGFLFRPHEKFQDKFFMGIIDRKLK